MHTDGSLELLFIASGVWFLAGAVLIAVVFSVVACRAAYRAFILLGEACEALRRAVEEARDKLRREQRDDDWWKGMGGRN